MAGGQPPARGPEPLDVGLLARTLRSAYTRGRALEEEVRLCGERVVTVQQQLNAVHDTMDHIHNEWITVMQQARAR